MKNIYQDKILYRICRPVITVVFKLLFTPRIIGQENIPKENKIVLAGNHTSIFDSLLLISTTKRNIHFLAKAELWKGPKKMFFSGIGAIPVDRSRANPEALNSAYNYLNNDKVIGIFPEGTTEKGRGLLPFKIGAVKMAQKTNSKIVPFVIKGKYKLFSRSLEIKFLKPVEPNKDLNEANDRLRAIIKNELEE